MNNFLNQINVEYFLWHCHQIYAARIHWLLGDISSNNGLSGKTKRTISWANVDIALWRIAPRDAVLERSIENCCMKNSEGPAAQHANLGTKLCSPKPTLCRRYSTISIRTISYLHSLNIQIFFSQRSRESNGVGLRVVMRITSHYYDVTNVCPDSTACAWQPPAGLPTTPLEIKYVPEA